MQFRLSGNPRVSICLPNLNNQRFLEERMRSILEQSYGDWELIVCDSYSDDGAWELLQEFKHERHSFRFGKRYQKEFMLS